MPHWEKEIAFSVFAFSVFAFSVFATGVPFPSFFCGGGWGGEGGDIGFQLDFVIDMTRATVLTSWLAFTGRPQPVNGLKQAIVPGDITAAPASLLR